MTSGMEYSGLCVGSEVVDRDKNGANMVVLELPNKPCDEWDIPGTGQTVADFNESYDPSDLVVITTYLPQLSEKYSEWYEMSDDELNEIANENGVKTYSYPQSRLKSVSCEMIPETVETYHDLISYQWARLIALSANKYNQHFILHNYSQLRNGEKGISSIEKENKYQLKDGFDECVYCGSEGEMEFEHIIPLSDGGSDGIENQTPSCTSCNSSKGVENVIDWLKEEHGGKVPRIVFGKYLKQRHKHLEMDDRLGDPLPDHVQDRWDGVEITRNVSGKVWV